ncbi:MAG: hypothetical protein J6Y08_01150 [Clostridiales bacterium]|nr:hypothetical protein [Clostridiales bacterium]
MPNRFKRCVSILSLTLMILLIGCAFQCSLPSKTELKKMFQIDLGNDTLTDVIEYGDGFICVVNKRELRVMTKQGQVQASQIMDEDITCVSAYRFISVSYGHGNVKIFSEDTEKGMLVEEYSFSFDKDVAATFGHYYVLKFDYLLEDGTLYRLSLPESEEDAEPDLDLCLEDVKLVGYNFAVFKDNSIMFIEDPDQKRYSPCKEEIVGVSSYGHFYTKSSAYESATLIDEEIETFASFDHGQFYAGDAGNFYVKDEQFYYQGDLEGEFTGPVAPHTSPVKVDIPQGYHYCAIRHGIVCYDEHTISCYVVYEAK